MIGVNQRQSHICVCMCVCVRLCALGTKWMVNQHGKIAQCLQHRTQIDLTHHNCKTHFKCTCNYFASLFLFYMKPILSKYFLLKENFRRSWNMREIVAMYGVFFYISDSVMCFNIQSCNGRTYFFPLRWSLAPVDTFKCTFPFDRWIIFMALPLHSIATLVEIDWRWRQQQNIELQRTGHRNRKKCSLNWRGTKKKLQSKDKMQIFRQLP